MKLHAIQSEPGEFGRLTVDAFEALARKGADALVLAFRGGALEKGEKPFPRDGTVDALGELSAMLTGAYTDRVEMMARAAVAAVRGAGGPVPMAKAEQAHRIPVTTHPVEMGPPPANGRKTFPHEGVINFQGLRILVENAKGSHRSGVDSDGKRWRVKMHAHYGEIAGTEGTDGDRLDVYVGDNADSPLAVVVHQQNPQTKAFDEDKVMLGFDTVADALAVYRKQYDRPGFYGGHEAMPIGRLLRWAKDPASRGTRVRKGSSFAALIRAAAGRAP